MSIYHKQCREIVTAFKQGKISRDTACFQLNCVEERAYARYPNAEPDGDITYCVASALDEIDEVNQGIERFQ